MANDEVMRNLEAEKAVLGALMNEQVALKWADKLEPDDFSDADNRRLFIAISTAVSAKHSIGLAQVDAMLTQLYGNIDLMPKLMEYVRTYGFAARHAMREHLAMLRECRKRREAYRLFGQLQDRIRDGMADVNETLEAARDGLQRLDRDCVRQDGMSLQSVLTNAFGELEKRAKGEEKGMPSGIEALDAVTAGFHRGEMTIIGARPAVGKSALAAQIALSASRAGNRVCILSREMTPVQYGIRVLARGTRISGSRLRSGELSDDDWCELTDSMLLYGNDKVRFLFSTRYIEDLRREVREMADGDGIDMLIVDYVQLMQTRQRYEKDYLRIGAISKALKDISVDYNIAVIALAQVGRSSEGDMPSLAELRGSGDLEQDADNVLFMHRPEDAGDRWVRPDDRSLFGTVASMGARYVVLNIAKHRQGETCAVATIFYPAQMRFENIRRRD